MPRINFHLQLAELKDKLLAMAALSQQALEFSVEAYLERDMALCDHVLEIEEAINTAETVVDEMAYELLAKEQPMAIDLRFILSVIKINGDLERIGDQAANIAERALALKDLPVIQIPLEIQEMGEQAGVMIRTAIQALLEADARMADSVLSMDDAVDERNKIVQAELMEVMQQQPEVEHAGADGDSGRAQPGALGRPCDQHRRRRDLLAARLRCAPQVLPGRGGVKIGRLRPLRARGQV